MSTNHFPSYYQEYIYLSRYSRWLPDKNRREHWPETVDRYFDFFDKHLREMHKFKLDKQTRKELWEAIYGLEAMPSMRCLMTAGEALERENVAGYNCSFEPIDSPRAFDEILYILMNGTGVGFSVESKYTEKLPVVAEEFHETDTTIVVADSKLGWAKSLKELIGLLYAGQIPKWDVSKVRPAGAPLKTFGGRASGPEPLVALFKMVCEIFKNAAGRKLTTLECHDIVCKIAEIVVVGGVRRSALISLSDLDDELMRKAKSIYTVTFALQKDNVISFDYISESGEVKHMDWKFDPENTNDVWTARQITNEKKVGWWTIAPQRALANNSFVAEGPIDAGTFMKEWLALYDSKSGERGIFSRVASQNKALESGRRIGDNDYGTNPCSEIILRPREFCNLTEVIVRASDGIEDLKRKVRIAAILGTFQSTLTNFKYITKRWKENCEEERLLGVSLTGILDNQYTNGKAWKTKNEFEEFLSSLKEYAVSINKEWAEKIGIPASAAVTCVKPSGCRPWDGLVTTDKGIFTLEDMMLHHDSETEWADVSHLNINTAGGRTTKTFINGMADVYKINLSLGYELKSTPNHQWYVEGKGWVRTDALKEGDVIEVQENTYVGTESLLKTLNPNAINVRTDAIQIHQPKMMTPDLAWFLGYLWGDGAMSPSRYRLRWTDARKENLEKAQAILKNIFNVESHIVEKQNEIAYTLEIGSKILWHWLIKNGVWKYQSEKLDVIPTVVRTSSKESVIAFLAGLFDADGWYGQGKATLTTADELFANHVQQVSLAVGLRFGRSKNTKGENYQSQKSMFLMNLCGGSDPDSIDTFKKHSNKISGDLNASNPQRVSKVGIVKSVVHHGREFTFDVETKDHWFLAGGFKSHNTVSQLTDTASGIHARHSEYYIRTVRADKKDPLAVMMKDMGFPVEDDVTKPEHTYVFSFPIKSPENAVFRKDMTAIEQLELWLTYHRHWCEHKPSVTITVTEDEWVDVGAWVYKHFDEMAGVSFLPYDGGSYRQAPYQDITKEQYEEWLKLMPEKVDWTLLQHYEKVDSTSGTQTLACTGAGSCEL